MSRSIDDFGSTWAQETEGSLEVLRSLTDASLAQLVVPGARTLGFLAWHITCSLTEMGGHAGLTVVGPAEKTHPDVPAKAAEIATTYEAAAASLAAAVRAQWTDAQTGVLIPMYGVQWPRDSRSPSSLPTRRITAAR